MARQRSTGPINQRIRTTFLDPNGMPLATTEYREELVEGDDGSMSLIKDAENIGLMSADSFNPSMAAGSKPIMLVGTCAICRRGRRRWFLGRQPTSHGLTNLSHLKHCVRCGRACCPLHRRRSSFDKSWRCPRCHRWHHVGVLLRTLFFKGIER